jgi:hypothetical protein
VQQTTTAFALTAALLAAIPSGAQQWGHGNSPRDGVCFYEDRDFKGEYFCVSVGESLGTLPNGMNDKISSLRIFGRAEVMVFRDVRFQGNSTRFVFDVSDLRREGWDKNISSLRVGQSTDTPSASRRMSAGDADAIVRRSYRELLNRDPDGPGLAQYRARILNDGWSEEDVRADIRKSPEFRATSVMTVDKARAIVRSAYLAVLKREPDAAGSSGYVDKVMREHWNQSDVERELRKSPEYRKK